MAGKNLKYWIPTVLVALAFIGGGVADLASPEMAENVVRLGFPAWFPTWLGVFKLIGAAVILAPGLARLKEWATAGMLINLSSAFVAHMAAGDAFGDAFPPLVIAGLVLASWAMRPADRKLASVEPAPRSEGAAALAA